MAYRIFGLVPYNAMKNGVFDSGTAVGAKHAVGVSTVIKRLKYINSLILIHLTSHMKELERENKTERERERFRKKKDLHRLIER